MTSKEIVSNRKALFNYEVLDTLEAGIVLTGTEIKSLRDHGGSLVDAYVTIYKEEAWLVNATIAPYRFGNINNHEERRKRKLLLHKYEITKLSIGVDRKGMTLIPLSFVLSRGLIKVRVGYCKGKKLHDKRRSIIEREKQREIASVMKKHYR